MSGSQTHFYFSPRRIFSSTNRVASVCALLLLALCLSHTACDLHRDGSGPVVFSDLEIAPGPVRPPVDLRFIATAPRERSFTLRAQYRVEGDATWRAASPAIGGDGISGLAASPWGVSHLFRWDATKDLEDDLRATAALRLISPDGIFESDPVEVRTDNDPPWIESRGTVRSVQPSTPIELLLYDLESDPLTWRARFSTGGALRTASVRWGDEPVQLAGGPEGVSFVLYWDVQDDLEPGDYNDVRLELTVRDALGPGPVLVMQPLSVSLAVTRSLDLDLAGATRRGNVILPFRFQADPEEVFELRTWFRSSWPADAPWEPMRLIEPGSSNLPYGLVGSASGLPHAIKWGSGSDLPENIDRFVEIRLQAVRTLVTGDAVVAQDWGSVAINNAPGDDGPIISEVYPALDGGFIEIYGSPGLDMSKLALLEIDRSGAFNPDRLAHIVEFAEETVIPEDGFLVVGSSEEVNNVDVVDPRFATFFTRGLPSNLVLLQPYDANPFYSSGQTGVRDKLGYGKFTGSTKFDGLCEITKLQLYGEPPEDPFEEDDRPCPFEYETPVPGPGQSLVREFSNLNAKENNLDFVVADEPTPGWGPLADPLQ